MTDATTRKTCYLITGLPRSGTSSVAQLLENLGVYFGDHAHFLDTSIHKHNPVFYELQWINDFNDRLIGAMGSAYFDDFLPIDGDFDADAVRALEPILLDQFRAEFGDRAMVGVKDPRLCFTLPFWRRALVAAGYDVKLVLTMRSPAAVMKSNSLLRNERPSYWRRFYARHLLAINYFAGDIQMCQVDFDRLMADPQPTAVATAACMGLPIADPAAAANHLSAQHYHHHPVENSSGDAWVDQIDEALRQNRLEPEQYLRFRSITALFADWTAERKDAEQRAGEIVAAKDAHIVKLEDAYRKISCETVTGLERLAVAKDEHIAKLEAMVRQSAEQIEADRQAIAQLEAELHRRDAQLHASEVQGQEHQAQLQQRNDQLQARDAELAHSEANLRDSRTEAAALSAELVKRGEELRDQLENNSQLTAELTAMRLQIEDLHRRTEQLARELSELRARRLVRVQSFLDRLTGGRPESPTNETAT